MQLIILTGLSGAGKTLTLDCLEDSGYYCIDNMPPALIINFMDLIESSGNKTDKVACCVDVRSGDMLNDMDECLEKLRSRGIETRIIYLEATDEVLIRRYKETRRTHPLSVSSVAKGLDREKILLARLRKKADIVVDTSKTTTANFKKHFKELVLGDEGNTFLINIYSFGFKHGIPTDADIVLDVRFIRNPYYVEELKHLSGNDDPVKEFVLDNDITRKFIDSTVELMSAVIPHFMEEGKFSLNVACGCTGGHHRSVAIANELGRRLGLEHKSVSVEHRDL